MALNRINKQMIDPEFVQQVEEKVSRTEFANEIGSLKKDLEHKINIARAYAHFRWDGTNVFIYDQYGVSSIVRESTGKFKVTLTKANKNQNYVVLVSGRHGGIDGSGNPISGTLEPSSFTTNSFYIDMWDDQKPRARTDFGLVMFVVYAN